MRQFLHAAAFSVAELPPPASHPTFELGTIVNPVDRPTPSFEGPLDRFAPPPSPAAEPALRAQVTSDWHGVTEVDPATTPRLDEADFHSVEIVIIPPFISRFVIAEKPPFEPVEPTLLQPSPEAGGTAPLINLMKTGERPGLISFGSPMPAGASQADLPSDREVFFVFPDWQFSDAGQIYFDNGSVDPRSRMIDLPHDFVADARVPISPLDGSRSASGSVSIDPAGNGQRQSSIGLAALLGQSAETESTLAGGGRAIVGASPANAGEGLRPDGFSMAHAAVGYLVAYDEIAVAAAGSLAALKGSRLVDDGLVAFGLEDLLTPHFVCDAAALSIALNDLAAQVDELGAGLLDLLADPLRSGEAAFVAGLAGAGLAYRHWRGGRRDERTEQEELLSSRFIRGHASLRLAGGGSR